MEIKVNCPYCWQEHTLDVKQNFEILSVHPPNFKTKFYNKYYFWTVRRPEKMNEVDVTCKKCSRHFHVEFYPYKLGDKRYSKDVNYYLGIAFKKENEKEVKPILEAIIDKISDKLHINSFFSSTLFMILLWLSLVLFPAMIFHEEEKQFRDYGQLLMMIIISISVIMWKWHLVNIRKYFTVDNLPIPLHPNYKKNSRWHKVLELQQFKGSLIGHPYQKVKPSTLAGLIAGFIAYMWNINYIINILPTLKDSSIANLPYVYTNKSYLLISGLHWSFMWFVVGNIIWFWLASTSIVYLIIKYIPLDIDIWDERGKMEGFSKLLLSSLYPTSLLAFLLPFMLSWSLNTQVPYAVLASVILTISYVLTVVVFFAIPLLPLHQQLKNQKKNELANVSKMIKQILKGNDERNFEKLSSLISIKKTIEDAPEWPIETKTVRKIVYAVVLPLFSLVINIVGIII